MNTFSLKTLIIGVQMLFVAFGALVLVPLLTGFDPSLALFAAGVGTLLFHLITGCSIPIFLGSSFAFIAPIQQSLQSYGMGATLGALSASCVVYFIFSLCFRFGGGDFLERFLPRVVTGPVVIVIGLKLAPTATANCVSFVGGAFDPLALMVAAIATGTAVIATVWGRGFLKLVPVITGVIVAYIVALLLGKVDTALIANAAWFAVPWTAAMDAGKYAIPTFDLAAILFILPVAIAPAVEHVGGIIAISSATGENYIKKPGLHRTLLGDGIASGLAPLFGGPPNTTYAEVTGAVALTKAFNPLYMRIAAVAAIIFAFCGKLNAVLSSIPLPVMGGIMVILFGMIAVVGIGTMIEGKVDLNNPRNMLISAIILTAGIGDLQIHFGDNFMLGGIGLAAIIGIVLNIILPKGK
ncbi:MAG: uracil-xanthine permease family protein [Deferribacteraceae bacterium]|jgi:uracil permease|nr:uracil-xanthine permease family protein [Deferribacteraceae bacterium]